MYLRQMTYKYIIREETVVSMTPECRFPLKQNLGFLYIGTAVSTLRNYGVKPPGILTEVETQKVLDLQAFFHARQILPWHTKSIFNIFFSSFMSIFFQLKLAFLQSF